jgi:hypothetical protein
VPPIIGRALFGVLRRPSDRTPRHAPGIAFSDLPHRTRPPYDASTLARAIRDSVSTSGYRFQRVMPRYELNDADMVALVAYLKNLPGDPSPGTNGPSLQLATIIAPGADAGQRDVFLEVLRACLDERQVRPRGAREGGWQLHVWELEGPQESWAVQLRERYARGPVFAVVSGLGGAQWAPVHRFCESERLPCLFPNIDLPGDAEEGIYSFYFSRGVLLEADLFATYLGKHRERLGIKRVLQLSADPAGAAAAAALRAALARQGVESEERLLELPEAAESGARWLAGAAAGDAIVLWLRADAIAALMQRMPAPPASQPVFMSGLLGGLERIPIAPAWQRTAYLSYPVDSPGRWEARARYNLRPWLQMHGLASHDERLQGNTLAACNSFAEAVYRTQGIYSRDYLLETVEYALSSMGNAGATAAFPRFVVGTGQRFVSKGGYIVRFARPSGTRLVPEGDWITP